MSIRTRITAVATVLVALVLMVSSAAVITLQRQQLTSNLDATLEQRSDQIIELLQGGSVVRLGPGVGTERFAQVVVDGEVVHSTENVEGQAAFTAVGGLVTVRNLPIEDDGYRLLARTLDIDGTSMTVIVGENTDDEDDALGALAIAMAVVVPLATAALCAMVWWLVGRTLRPVEAIRREVAELGPGDLDRRVSLPPVEDEIHELADTMNVMLGRLEGASIRQRQFISDASHELRSPLTRLRTELEVELRTENDPDFEAACRSALAEVVEMQALVEELLFLARQDEGLAPQVELPVDLGRLVTEECEVGDPIHVSIPMEPVEITGDEAQLRRLIRNLVENALRHAQSSVRVELVAGGDNPTLIVEDDGPGIPLADRSAIFERFTRVDESRSVEHGGAGLGLAIARDIAVRHGGTVSVDDAAIGGARFVVSFA